MKKFILIFAIVGLSLVLSGCLKLTQSVLSVAFVNDYSGSMSSTSIT